jgi:hypothetical protein
MLEAAAAAVCTEQQARMLLLLLACLVSVAALAVGLPAVAAVTGNDKAEAAAQ